MIGTNISIPGFTCFFKCSFDCIRCKVALISIYSNNIGRNRYRPVRCSKVNVAIYRIMDAAYIQYQNIVDKHPEVVVTTEMERHILIVDYLECSSHGKSKMMVEMSNFIIYTVCISSSGTSPGKPVTVYTLISVIIIIEREESYFERICIGRSFLIISRLINFKVFCPLIVISIALITIIFEFSIFTPEQMINVRINSFPFL